jgi:hypothetical protein
MDRAIASKAKLTARLRRFEIVVVRPTKSTPRASIEATPV